MIICSGIKYFKTTKYLLLAIII